MEVFYNNQKLDIDDQSTLFSFVSEQIEDTNGLAVAINDEIISKAAWKNTTLNNNDKILIIKATQGG